MSWLEDNIVFERTGNANEKKRCQKRCDASALDLAPEWPVTFDPKDKCNERQYGQHRPGRILAADCQQNRACSSSHPPSPARLKDANEKIDRQHEEEHRRHVHEHERRLAQKIGHAEQERSRVKAGIFVPQHFPDQAGEHRGHREEEGGENLDGQPGLAEHCEEQSMEKRHCRKVCPGRNAFPPLAEKVGYAVLFEVFRLHEIPRGIDVHLGVIHKTAAAIKHAEKSAVFRKREGRVNLNAEKCDGDQQDTRNQGEGIIPRIDDTENPVPARVIVVIEPSERILGQRNQRTDHYCGPYDRISVSFEFCGRSRLIPHGNTV